jgi:hypothetical protein
MPNHTWILKDDLMILYVYKFGFDRCPLTRQEMADRIGVSLGSLNYRIGNFNAIDGIGNATHFAKLSQMVHERYSTLSEEKLKKLAFSHT